MTLTVKTFRSIDEIGHDILAAINYNDPFFTYEWFKVLETQTCFPNVPYYIAVFDNENFLALAPCFKDLNDVYFNAKPKLKFVTLFFERLLALGYRFGFCQNHILLCYSPSSGRSNIICQNDNELKRITNLLFHELDALCRKERYLFSAFPFVSGNENRLPIELSNASYFKRQGITNFYLDINWQSYDDYLMSLNSNTRRNIKKKMRKFQDSGISVEEQDFDSFSYEELANLLHNITIKYNKDAKKIIQPSFFDDINKQAGDKIKLFIAKKNQRIVGYSLLFYNGTIADCWMCGFDYDALSSTDYAYFNLVYYEPIKWAIKEGIKKINFRSKSEKAKIDCGCQPEQMFAFTKCHDIVLGPFVNFFLRSPFWPWFSKYLADQN